MNSAQEFWDWVERQTREGQSFSGSPFNFNSRAHHYYDHMNQQRGRNNDCPYSEYELIRMVARVQRDHPGMGKEEALRGLAQAEAAKHKKTLKAIMVSPTQFYIPLA